MQTVVPSMQFEKWPMLVPKQAIIAKFAILASIRAKIEEISAILSLILVADARCSVFGELFLAVGEVARIPPALGSSHPIEAELVALL